MASITSPAKTLELTSFLKFVTQGDGELVYIGRTARSSTMDVNLSANCAMIFFMVAVNDWWLWGFDNDEVDKAAVARLVSRPMD